ncbi:MAG: hypothetical protein CEN90_212 [Parcubacteria group bacterium Licking1014_17]|nr:MAG: hypothetical protein CEN90_212 [Parcubacteria group bacterium Licking1014_17]
MCKNILRVFVVSTVIIGGFWAISASVHAMSPVLSVSATGSGDNVQMTVNGDSNSSVTLYYQKNYYGQQSQYIGMTDYNGYFSIVFSTSFYGVIPGSQAYVMVNSQQSSSVTWPGTGGSGSLSLSQTNLTLTIGQSSTITAYNSGASIYISGNTNPSVATSSISGSQISVYGSNYGSATITICLSSYSSNCASIYVTVQYQSGGNMGGGQISFSQNNVSINIGGTASITISGGATPYNMFPDTLNIFDSVIGNNTITIIGKNTGSGSLRVCSYNQSYCGTLYITVGSGSSYNNYNYNYNNQLSFSQNNPSLTIGQSMNISIYGGSGGSYYAAYNSNPGSMQVNLSGSNMTLTGMTNSATVVVICASTNSCGALNVNIGGSGSYQSGWTFCAGENQMCYFNGTHQVRYGANNIFYYGTYTNSVSCSNYVFRDPAFGYVKQCSYGN